MVFGWFEWFLDGLNGFWMVLDGLIIGDRENVCMCVCGCHWATPQWVWWWLAVFWMVLDGFWIILDGLPIGFNGFWMV